MYYSIRTSQNWPDCKTNEQMVSTKTNCVKTEQNKTNRKMGLMRAMLTMTFTPPPKKTNVATRTITHLCLPIRIFGPLTQCHEERVKKQNKKTNVATLMKESPWMACDVLIN